MNAVTRLCLVAIVLAVPRVHAEPLYVIDQLVVSVSSAPAGAGEHIATIHSGERVELLSRQGDEAQIRLPNGTEGWVKGSYLSGELPLQRRLLDRTAEVEKLKMDVSRLQSELATARTAASTAPAPATATPAAVPAAPPAAGSPPSSATVRDAGFFLTPPDQPAHPVWEWVLAASTGTLALGFLAGWRALDRRIRRKYGGLRIY
jgi:hypothetical protein